MRRKKNMAMHSDLVSLNVGGKVFLTSIKTLTKHSNSMLGVMFSGQFSYSRDEAGRHFIDANGDLFQYILDYLRRNKLVVPHGFSKYDALLAEAEYFQIQPLIQCLRQVLNSNVVTVNVGGTIHSFPLTILDKIPHSRLTALIKGENARYDEKGICFVNGDGKMFRHILNYLRKDELILPSNFEEYDLLLLEAQYYEIEPLVESIQQSPHRFDVVTLNVNDKIYHTTLKTLRKYPHSTLFRMLNIMDAKGRFVIDGNGEVFKYVLGYIRSGRLVLPDGFKSHDTLLRDALNYDIPPLVEEVRKLIPNLNQHGIQNQQP